MRERPKLWSFDRKTEVDAVDRATRSRKYRRLCYRVIDAVLEIRQTGQVTPEHLRAFMDALECRDERVFSQGGKRLAQCSHFAPAAGEQLLRAMDSPKWRTRFNTVAVMDEPVRKDVLLAVLRKGLRDERADVREMADSRILGQNLLELLPEIQKQASVEPDAQVRESMEQTANWLQGKPVMMDGEPIWLVRRKDGRSLGFVREDPAKTPPDV